VVAAGAAGLDDGEAAEFAPPDDERAVEQSPLPSPNGGWSDGWSIAWFVRRYCSALRNTVLSIRFGTGRGWNSRRTISNNRGSSPVRNDY
jgi:hypothetical protein